MQGNFLLDNFVNRGMVADFAVHQPDKEDGGISNPHFHVMCPIRPIEPDGRWGNKQRREYVLDGTHEERVLDEAGNYVFNAVPTTDWGNPKRWKRGGRHGLTCAMPSLPKKAWTVALTIAALPVRVWSRFQPSTKVPPSGQWRQRASAPTKAISTAYSENQRAATGGKRENRRADRLAEGRKSRACQAPAAHAQRSAGAALRNRNKGAYSNKAKNANLQRYAEAFSFSTIQKPLHCGRSG